MFKINNTFILFYIYIDFFSIELNQFIQDYQNMIKKFQNDEVKASFFYFFSSYSYPYQNLIKLNMNRLLDRLQVFQKDWSETSFLKEEATQYYYNVVSSSSSH